MLRRPALFLTLLLAACARAAPVLTPTSSALNITLAADGKTNSLTLPAGSLVSDALDAQSLTLGELDRVTPSEATLLADGMLVKVVRVIERLEIEHTVLPYERQTVRNEGLAAGESRLLQPGV